MHSYNPSMLEAEVIGLQIQANPGINNETCLKKEVVKGGKKAENLILS